MPKHKNMLKTYIIDIAKRRRKCYHDDVHVITKGDPVLVIKDGPFKSTCYCHECAAKMITMCRGKLEQIETAMLRHIQK